MVVIAPLIKTFTYKAVLSTALIAAACLRPCLLSSIFLLLGLIAITLPSTKPASSGLVTAFCWTAFGYSAIAITAQSIYQIYAAAKTTDSHYNATCTDYEWWREVGFVKFHGAAGFESSLAFLPELIAFVASLVTLTVVVFFSHSREEPIVPDNTQRVRGGTDDNEGGTVKTISNAVKRFTNFLIIVGSAVVASVQPSIFNFVYLVAFLYVATWWAMYRKLRHEEYNKIKKTLLCYAIFHLMVIYIYQTPVVSSALPSDQLAARLLGLSTLMTNDCPYWWKYVLNKSLPWPVYANPIAILVFFIAQVIQLSFTRHGRMRADAHADGSSSVHEDVGTAANPLLVNDEESPPPGEGPSTSIPLRRVTSQTVDQHKISRIFRAAGGGTSAEEVEEPPGAAQLGAMAVANFVIYHSYAFALLSMMVWALLYHSIFGLVLLLLTCVLWMFKDTREKSFLLSPVLLGYVEILLLIQYACSMHITANDITVPEWANMVGFVLAGGMNTAFLTMVIKLLLSLPVFFLLRLHLRNHFYNNLTDSQRAKLEGRSYGTFGGAVSGILNQQARRTSPPSSRRDQLISSSVQWVSYLFSEYFLIVVLLVLLIVAVSKPANIFLIGFFSFWSLFLVILKSSFLVFRKAAYLYWLLLIFYTSVVIISLYVYQFPEFPSLWQRLTGIDYKWNKDIGLINYKDEGQPGSLFGALVAPIVLFVVGMLQLKFFHEPWSNMVQPVRDAEAGVVQPRSGEEGEPSLTSRIVAIVNQILDTLWRFTEIHISKIVFLIVAIFAANNISALYLPVMIFISLAVCLPSSISRIISLVMCTYLAVVAILKMVYQLDHVPDLNDLIDGTECNSTKHLPEWIGFKKNQNVFQMLVDIIIAMIALGVQSAVIYRQQHHRIVNAEPEEYKNRVFPNITKTSYDNGIVDLFKFLVDFGFFKFGFEICMGIMAINAWVRMDLLGAISCLCLAFFASTDRKVARRVWPIYLLYMAAILPIQYAIYVGLPQDLCLDYPWASWFTGDTKNVNFDIWIGAPNYEVQWPAANLVADFFLLLAASCQLTVFRTEGEENDSIFTDEQYQLLPNNPRYDFIAIQRSFVDFLKIAIFHYGHWITLIATLVAGIGGTSLFALGYIILTFAILWQGNNLYVMNAQTNSFKNTLKRWKILTFYTVFTMFFKVVLQLAGCVFLEWFSKDDSTNGVLCVARQLFSITCVNSIMKHRGKNVSPLFPGALEFDRRCAVDPKEAQIGFDAIALVFLVFQMRIFHTWFFQHCMVEYRSEVILANRGAVLKNQLIEKEMKEQNVHQSEKFDEIRKRTQAIRARYNKQLEKGVGLFEPQTYGQAKRAGDYYMFDYDPSTDELVQPVESFIPEPTPGATDFDKLDPGQLVYTAASRDMDLADTMKRVTEAEKIKEAELRMIEAVGTAGTPLGDNRRSTASAPAALLVEATTPVDNTEEPSQPSESKIVSILRFLKKMTVNGMDMISASLNKLSREHRYVAFVLKGEKEKLKLGHPQSLSDTSRKLTDLRSGMDMTSLHLVQSESDIEIMESAAQDEWQKRSAVARLTNALGNCIAANTDFLCYFLAILAHAMGAGLITLPLPLMVFLWGTLSNPRPSKVFWVAMIAYTEFVIVVKFVCQFTFFDFNQPATMARNALDPMSLEKVFGVQRVGNFALFDVPLLFALFFHRYMLRKLGLWKDANLTVTFPGDETDAGEGGLEMVTPAVDDTQESSLEVTDGNGAERTAAGGNGNGDKKKQNPLMRFIQQLFNPKFRYIRDLYPIMFALDVLAFLIISLGYSGFGEGGSGSVIGDIQKSRIPLTLVVMLIVMTLMIVIDRGLYLRKWVYGKLAYQLIIIVFIHVWIFFILPEITRKSAIENHVAQALYIVKSLYLIVSAWQIRNGYPQLCIGNLLTHAYGLANMVFFKIFMAVPFLFELRTAIDWTWTDTSMPLFDFFNMENFYAVIYNLKCARTFEQSYPAPRGVPKGMIVKYLMGLPMILLIVLLVWSPLLAFSLLNQIGDVSIPDSVRMTISFEGYPPIYQIEAQGSELRNMNTTEYKWLLNNMSTRYQPNSTESIKRSRNSVAYIKDYTEQDILVVSFRPESEVFWPISDESMNALIAQLKGDTPIKFQVAVTFTRPYDQKKKTAAKHEAKWDVDVPVGNMDLRNGIIDALQGKGKVIRLPETFPSYMLVPSEGQVSIPEPLAASILEDQDGYQLPANATRREWFDSLTLRVDNTTGKTVWTALAEHPPQFKDVFFDPSPTTYEPGENRTYIQTVAFVDRAFPSFFAAYLQGGVIAMYLSLVIVVGRLIRGVFTNSPTDVIISEIPNPDFLLKICLDIYLVREAQDFFLEQDLFAKLIFLFRSPATLIQWTRYKVKDE